MRLRPADDGELCTGFGECFRNPEIQPAGPAGHENRLAGEVEPLHVHLLDRDGRETPLIPTFSPLGSDSTSLNQTRRSFYCLGMIFSENRFTLFGIMP